MFAQNSVDFTIFRGHARQGGRGFGALAQALGRTAILFIKKIINPAAKITGAALFEILLLQRGGVVSGHKKIRNSCKRCGIKNSLETVGRWKKEIQA